MNITIKFLKIKFYLARIITNKKIFIFLGIITLLIGIIFNNLNIKGTTKLININYIENSFISDTNSPSNYILKNNFHTNNSTDITIILIISFGVISFSSAINLLIIRIGFKDIENSNKKKYIKVRRIIATIISGWALINILGLGISLTIIIFEIINLNEITLTYNNLIYCLIIFLISTLFLLGFYYLPKFFLEWKEGLLENSKEIKNSFDGQEEIFPIEFNELKKEFIDNLEIDLEQERESLNNIVKTSLLQSLDQNEVFYPYILINKIKIYLVQNDKIRQNLLENNDLSNEKKNLYIDKLSYYAYFQLLKKSRIFLRSDYYEKTKK